MQWFGRIPVVWVEAYVLGWTSAADLLELGGAEEVEATAGIQR
jgi:hypothetical protein